MFHIFSNNHIFFLVQGPKGPTGPKGELGFPGRPVCIMLSSRIKTEEIASDTYYTISTYFRAAQDWMDWEVWKVIEAKHFM